MASTKVARTYRCSFCCVSKDCCHNNNAHINLFDSCKLCPHSEICTGSCAQLLLMPSVITCRASCKHSVHMSARQQRVYTPLCDDKTAANVDSREEGGRKCEARCDLQTAALIVDPDRSLALALLGKWPPPIKHKAPAAVRPETAFVTLISGECSAGDTFQT